MSDQTSNPADASPTLINAYEDMVNSRVRELMNQDPEVCQCEKCVLDVCALVFNNKRYDYTRFVTTTAGTVLAKLNELSYGRQTEMTVAILEAIEKVKESPQH